MSTHPNVVLMVALTPHGLARKTMAGILADAGVVTDVDDLKIGDQNYHHRVMESDYYEEMQIAAKEGDLVFFDLVTYGYGETIAWSELEARKNVLEDWAKVVCAKHACDYRIEVTANYW